MLAALLVVILGGTGGGLYYSGYWDTWADKHDAFVTEISDSMDPRAPEQAKKLFSECAATALLDLADTVGCDKPTDGPVSPQVVACLKPEHGNEAAELLMKCIMDTQVELQKAQVIK